MSEQKEIRKFSTSSLKQSFKQIKWQKEGKVVKIVGLIIEANLPDCQVGTIVEIKSPARDDKVLGEVVGFRDDLVLLLPYSYLNGIAPGCPVSVLNSVTRIPCSDKLLGRVVDPFLNPLSGPNIEVNEHSQWFKLDAEAPNPLERQRITSTLSLGVRALDGLLTLGQGQRIGIMAGSGVGKSVLMGMMARNSAADVNVIALIGERGREVREFIEKDLSHAGLAKSVVVTVTSDQSPLMRIRGAKTATTIAEYFAAQGKSVLLMIDSLTRIAMAQREIGNAVGEPPTTKGYTPSVFSLLPKLLERAGPQKPGWGAISGLYTVLVDGDDFNDPIVDAARSILDGHINLSRDLAAKGHFPAIEVTTSASRVMHDIATKDHLRVAAKIKELIAVYKENSDLIQIGAYQTGANPLLDQAIAAKPAIDAFLKQEIAEPSRLEDAVIAMKRILSALES
jgi:flagellum-specific ATP synthase